VSGLQVTVVGGKMITQDQLLPSLYQLQRQGIVGDLAVCAINRRPLQALADSEALARAFPEAIFSGTPRAQ
jgi:glucose-6-phosphate 1-dehydrogenase